MHRCLVLLIVGCAAPPSLEEVPHFRPPGEITCVANVEPLTHTFATSDGAWGDELAALLRDRCLSDHWSASARACADASGYPSCLAAHLDGWQRERLLGVVASNQRFDLASTPHLDTFACDAGCDPPATSPCEHADQCRLLAWPAAASTCFAAHGLVAACIDQLTPTQKHDPEIVIAMWLQQVARTFSP